MVRGTFLENEPMSKHTTYGIGGPVTAFLYPVDENDLETILKFAHSQRFPVYVIGSGSNLLVSNHGFDGIVISLRKTFKELRIPDRNVYVQSGVIMSKFVKECAKHNLTGMENLMGIPGTLGGALVMNAGAYGEEISNHLIHLDIMSTSGKKKRIRKIDIVFDYRYSSLMDSKEIILSAEFEFDKGVKEEIQDRMSQAITSRKTSQPIQNRSAGSVFKNPPDTKPAGYLIDQAGLKGVHRGDAEISAKHANFFINCGNATAEDMAKLIRLARKTVKEKFGVYLNLEIETLGFPKNFFDA